MRNLKLFLLVIILLISSNKLIAQSNKKLTASELENWFKADLGQDSIAGISFKKAKEFLKNKEDESVVIGVIETSIDISHKDLKNWIWKNKNEIEGNGIDDDNNGYIDDINGWNYIGNLTKLNYEYERIIINPKLVEDKSLLKKANKEYNALLKEITKDYKDGIKTLKFLKKRHSRFTEYFQREDYTLNDILKIETSNKDLIKEIKSIEKRIEFSKRYFGKEIEQNEPYYIANQILATKKHIIEDSLIVSGQSIKTDYRKSLGDDLENLNDKQYGNNIVDTNLDEEHGTHISGILVANSISKNYSLMPLRINGSVGDEHDKDVALSIRYAVDNGAKVINASFEKYYSPYSDWVYEAIKYAEEKDVLIIIAAGNYNLNRDETLVFPNDNKGLKSEFTNNAIVVGSSKPNYGKYILSYFSNYGKDNVDIFAPGNKIYSMLPENKYGFKSGTSMAAPMVTAIAATIRSYYPNLSAKEVKEVILNSGTKINFEVNIPSERNKSVNFSELCKSSSVVNYYNAVVLAETLSLKK
ncbi:S8 family serine peptidase [Tenacibaculum haliotis]|uniref:S8 family serine peptidase n=1 Tax=Tenacibaculum haliotis TaxID=1888914 RepID=UPI0021AF9C6A|nr:S8 family serine peptidase [Tenacibaculum haliotis]MCT4697569.1 S8 family serine peptidase [Tenacibaculum haliotis]